MTVPPHAPEDNASVGTILYAGGAVRELTLDMTVQGLSGEFAEVRLTTMDRRDLRVWRAADVPGDGHLTGVPTVPASAVRLIISTPSGVPWPNVVVNSIAVREAPTGPEEGALIVSSGDTVDTVFTEVRRALFLKVAPLGHDAIDLVGFGAGDLGIGDPTTTDYILDPSHAWSAMALARPGGPVPSGMIRFGAQIVSASQPLRLTWVPPDAAAVQATPDPGHARLVIREVNDLKLAFPARDRDAFFGHWFGVDHDGSTMPPRNCKPQNLPCVENEQLDKLSCTDWNGRSGLVTDALTGTRAPAPGPPVCYDGHRGTDFGLRGAVIGQEIGVDVMAAQAGVVVFADDGHPDACFYSPFAGGIRCRDIQYKRPFWDELKPGPETQPNLIGIRQDNGLVAWYFHLRRGSVGVVAGQTVKCGQKLGQVGSSGDSAGPHLHYELRELPGNSPMVDAFGYRALLGTSSTVDPFPDRWASWSDGAPPANACP